MSGGKEERSRDDIRLSISMQADNIEKSLLVFSKLFDEFSTEWLLSVEANYLEFLNYFLCSIKKFHECKKSS